MGENCCKNCNEPIIGNYCSNCGHPVKLKKIDRSYIIHEIKGTLFADKGFLYTTKRMLLTPGDSVRQYITENRSRYVKPVTYLIIICLIYTIITRIFKIDYLTYFSQGRENQIGRLMIEYLGYASIILGLYMAFWIKLFFKKSGYNIFEIFVLVCYVSGVQSLIQCVIVIIQALIHSDLMVVSIIISYIYYFWAIGQFFEKKKAKNYIKAIFSYIVGMIAMIAAIFLIAFVAGIIMFIIRQ